MTWLEQKLIDPTLRDFIDAEITRAGIKTHTADLEIAHLRRVIDDQARQIAALKAEIKAEAKRRGK